MCRIGVEEAAAIGAQHLDGFLGRNWSLGYQLLKAVQANDMGVGAQILGHALPYQNQRDYN